MWRGIFHLVMTSYYVFSLWYDQNYVNLRTTVSPENDIRFFKGRVKYLTMWNMVCKSAYNMCMAI